jgi:Tfp pilus assembly major pilin PilA
MKNFVACLLVFGLVTSPVSAAVKHKKVKRVVARAAPITSTSTSTTTSTVVVADCVKLMLAREEARKGFAASATTSAQMREYLVKVWVDADSLWKSNCQ